MGNPEDNTAATDNVNDELSLSDQVNLAVKAMTYDEDKEVWNLPTDLPENVMVAATAEKRRRDTQASLTKSNQKLKALEATNSALQEELKKSVKVSLTQEQTDELEDLKYSDPEAWRVKMNNYESQAHSDLNAKLTSTYTDADKAAELSRREEVLAEFLAANPNTALNDDIIANDVPPRLTKRLEEGAISFEEFLEEAKDFIVQPTFAIANEENKENVNLSKVGGGSEVAAGAVEEDIITSYSGEVY